MRAIVALALAAMLTPAAAAAHRSDTSRVHNMRHIAVSVYGPALCGDTMAVPIRRGPMPPNRSNAVAVFDRGPGATLPYTGCSITVKDQRWNTEYLCRIIAGHEFGHAAGLEHVDDPSSIMWPYALGPWQPCADGAAEPRASRKPRVTPLRGPLVLLLPGGGWQHADPETMRPWLDDFARAGIRARAITYPLKDVLGAIEHVRKVAATEPGVVVAYGISAGGTIAAALAAQGAVAGAVNLVGPTDFERWVGPGADRIMRQIGMTTPQAKRAASPFHMLAGRQSPQLVMCGLADPLVTWDQCQRYAAAAHKGEPDTRLVSMVNAHGQSSRDRMVAREWIAARWPANGR